MDRMETARRLYAQAQRITITMAASVVAYGAIGFYLVHMGKAGPMILKAQTYPFVKYGALLFSVVGIFAMWQLGSRMFSIRSVQVPPNERSVQKLFVKTILMCAGAELPLLFGMILVFLGRRPYDFIPFALVSLSGFAFAFPKKQQWVSWLDGDF